MNSNLTEKALRKHNKSFATKRISQKENQKVFQTKFVPKQKEVLEQSLNENENQKFDKPVRKPFVPYIKNYPSRGPKQVWVPKFV